MKKISGLLFGIFIVISCANSNKLNVNAEKSSEWRDNNGVDTKSFYTSSELCEKIIGKFKIRSRLHKNALEKDVFNGGMSSRWLEIGKDSIIYYTPYGEVADSGLCNCKDDVLTINWNVRYDRQIEYKIHFNSADTLELRYYDYPYSLDTFSYDKTKEPTNPTKLIGIMKR
ncbi:hypothetical protein IMCC3317_19860 [Kordia antarctica]|uniref:Lipoprotein n=1 Tax=Kordia antarctica TaxID=1218801 RepID=A0A7L4ZIT3_9FLAO|nr:hypothetical protein [Kordia antarctica]QHI36623.1 hypothetical protein IMCC3317_19860 [Kordia antarctica]